MFTQSHIRVPSGLINIWIYSRLLATVCSRLFLNLNFSYLVLKERVGKWLNSRTFLSKGHSDYPGNMYGSRAFFRCQIVSKKSVKSDNLINTVMLSMPEVFDVEE